MLLLLPQLPLHGPALVMPRASPRQSKANQANEDDQQSQHHQHVTVPHFQADETIQQRNLSQRYSECGSAGGGHGPPLVMPRASPRQSNDDDQHLPERRLSQRYNDTASVCLRGADTGSVCSSATRHWVNSVSDIYGPDEIEELLEDLNKLELAAFETDEDFDIDGSQIGGGRRWRRSWSRSRSRFNSSGVYNSRPALAPHSSIGSGIGAFVRESSPTPSDRSWDSHAVYQVPNEDEDEVDLSRRRRKKRGRLRADWEEQGQEQEQEGENKGNQEENQEEDDCDDGLEGIFQSKSILCYCDTSTFKTPRTALRVLLLVSILVY